jgi:hypothetical protein
VRKHCLVRTPADVLLAQAALRHREQQRPASTTPVPAWSDRLRPQAVAWRSEVPGPWIVEWCLEAEPAANGTLAHLSATISGRSQAHGMAAMTVLSMWAGRELSALARTSEALHGPYRRLS